jgi:hypothetical protein
MKTKIIMAVLLGILVIMSFVQGMQISNLENVIIGLKENSEKNSGASPYSNPRPNVPAMVGGC